MLDQPCGSTQTDRRDETPSGAEPALCPTYPFVGRIAEVAELVAGLGSAAVGRGQSFVISGEPGIGKTRLASQFATEARARGAVVCWGRCWEAGGAPSYWPWIEVIRQLMRDLEPPLIQDLERAASHLASIVPELAERLDKSDTPSAPSCPDSARFLVFDAVASLLRSIARHRLLVLIIDDFHAADQASLLLLAFLARTLADCPVVLVGTYRTAELSASADLVEPVAELIRHARRVVLRGLSASDVGLLIKSATGRTPSSLLIGKIHSVTDGNPFFIDEILRLLVSEGRLQQDIASAPSFGVPDGVREAVRRRIEPLSDGAISLLRIAAVAGREFDTAVLAAAAHLDSMAVVEALDEPMRHGLIVEVPDAAGRFAFRHALIRDAIYEALTPASRLRLHHRIGETLESLSGADPDLHVAELAHHFLAAASCCDDERYIAHGTRAARQAMNKMAFEEAVVLYQRTIDTLVYAREDERRRCELLLALAEAREWANDTTGSRSAVEQAAAIARRLGAGDLLARAAMGIGGIVALKWTARSVNNGEADLLREALDQLPAHETATRALLRSRLALHHLSPGSRPAALALSADAVADARASNDRVTLTHALIARHGVLLGPDHLEERQMIAEDVLRLATEIGSREFEMRGHALRVTNLLEIGDLKLADESIEAHGRLATATRDPFERWVNATWRAARALLVGRFEEAEQHAQHALDLTRTVPGHHATEVNGPMAYSALVILTQDTRYDGIPDAVVIDYYRSRYPELAAWHVAHLLRLTRLGDIEDVKRELQAPYAQKLVDLDRDPTWLAAMSYLSDALALVGDRERAAALYDLLAPYGDRNASLSLVAFRGSMNRPLAVLAATMGRLDDAIQHFEAALVMNRRMGALPHVAITLYDYGKVLISQARAGDAARARDILREAHRIAGDLGMSGLVGRCAELLRDGRGALPDPVAPSDGFELAKEGQFWILSRGTQRVLLKDAKGLAYLAELLRHPDRDIHVLELIASFAGASGVHETARLCIGHDNGAARELIDAKALRAYRRQLERLQEQLESAQSAGDPEHVLALREEIDTIGRELARATRLGGRVRRDSDAERARISVTRTIRLALRNILDAAPDLGGELARSVRTGTFCCYAPARPS